MIVIIGGEKTTGDKKLSGLFQKKGGSYDTSQAPPPSPPKSTPGMSRVETAVVTELLKLFLAITYSIEALSLSTELLQGRQLTLLSRSQLWSYQQ